MKSSCFEASSAVAPLCKVNPNNENEHEHFGKASRPAGPPDVIVQNFLAQKALGHMILADASFGVDAGIIGIIRQGCGE